MTDNVLTQRRGAVLEVTLNRPKANAIDMATSRELGEIFTEFRDDPALRVALLTAQGEKFFCPGWDLKVEKVILRVLSNTASTEDKQIVSDASFALRCVVRRPRYWAPLFALARSRIGG